MKIEAALFDLGKVLLDWDPRYFYRSYFDEDPRALEAFIATAVPGEWVLEMDAGKPMAQAISERQRAVPRYAGLISLWKEGWPSMLRGEIEGTAAILRDLKSRGIRLHALTNFSNETWPIALARCPSLALFEDVVVSAQVGMVKPDPRIYALALQRCALQPARTVFIDDLKVNVAAARAAGLRALQFSSPDKLRADLAPLLA